jgi:cholesterol oxidase
MANYDVIIVGSGFGGAVAAARLAESGMKVLVLERGRRWQTKDYPRDLDDAWVWNQSDPKRQNGWLDLRIMDDMAVAQGAGVGGGSLIYANISVEAKPDAFTSGWPVQITYETLRPYYDKVGKMLNVHTLPLNQLTERYRLMQESAQALGYADRFMPLPMAVTFNPEWRYGLPDAFNDKHSKPWINAQGQQQGTCVHCGNCDIGCQVKAKNTLDLNYIPLAEKHGAEVRALHIVSTIKPIDGGYAVHFSRIESGRLIAGQDTATRVIVAAGSLGSTELLLRCRDLHRTLPKISQHLGQRWSSNGDFLTPASYKNRRVAPTEGPTITCAIDFLDGKEQGKKFFIEDGGFPNLLRNFLKSRSKRWRKDHPVLRWMLHTMGSDAPLNNIMPWFGQSMDAANGRLYLGRPWYAPWRRQLKLDWDVAESEDVISAMVDMHKRLSSATGGEAHVPPTWSVLKNLVTPHPLGGCNMGTTAADGVVDHRGQVFGYVNLFVADGAIVPRAIGLNPSRTIAALAERISEKIALDFQASSR